MKASDVRASLLRHREELVELEQRVRKLRLETKAEESWLRANGFKVGKAARLHVGQLLTLVDFVLAKEPLTVREITEKVVKKGYVPASPGRPFTKVVRMLLYHKPDLFVYDPESGKWKRNT